MGGVEGGGKRGACLEDEPAVSKRVPGDEAVLPRALPLHLPKRVDLVRDLPAEGADEEEARAAPAVRRRDRRRVAPKGRLRNDGVDERARDDEVARRLIAALLGQPWRGRGGPAAKSRLWGKVARSEGVWADGSELGRGGGVADPESPVTPPQLINLLIS